MSDVDDLVAWFRACLDEDERDALDAKGYLSGVWTYVKTPGGDYKVIDDLGYSVSGHYDVDSEPWRTQPHIARFDPDRMLREVKANRLILDRYEERCERVRNPVSADARAAARVGQFELEGILRLLALPLDDRPGYREEWRP